MADIGEITGPIALFITLIWWFGLTPKKIAQWVQRHKLINRVWNEILPLIFAGVGTYLGIFQFVAGPIYLGANKWMVGGFWILISLSFIFRTEERHVRRYLTILTRGISLERIGTLLLIVSMPLLIIGRHLSLTTALIGFGVATGSTVIIVVIIFLLVRRSKRDTAK